MSDIYCTNCPQVEKQFDALLKKYDELESEARPWNIEDLRRENEQFRNLIAESNVRLVKEENQYLRGLLEEILDFDKQTKKTYENFKLIFENRQMKYCVQSFYKSVDYFELFKDKLLITGVEISSNGATPPCAGIIGKKIDEPV